jgi:HlyD family secretion protein
VLAVAAIVAPAPDTTGGSGVHSAKTAAPGGDWTSARADGSGPRPQWAASATGRIEPKDGEVRIASQVAGRIADVPVKSADRVSKGDTLVKLDDEDHWIRHAAAEAEAHVRKRERDEDPEAKGPSERRRLEDAAFDADRGLFRARMDFESVLASFRAGRVNQLTVDEARGKIKTAEEKVAKERAALAQALTRGMPLPTRLEASLAAARSDLGLAEQAIEKTRIRAPYEGTVLTVPARAGELAAPSPEAVLVTFGDVSSLKVRAEVEERDATRVKIGQRVVVRADAYPEREFEGKVTQIGSALGAPRINTRGPRRPNDVEVLEVQAALDGAPPLLTGMRVDVFFRNETTVSAAPQPKN